MEKRYLKNEKMLTREENLSLREKKVIVVGCGGLGGHIIEQLARLGIGHITAIDGDVFDESNLNRQLLKQC
jgi:molybdopterin-synthase adenylyltransferase